MSKGAHSWVRKAFNIAMEGEQTEYVWGVIDFTPDTDFPDIRNKCVIHSNNGTCMVIPREGDKVRLYIQLDSKNDADTSTMKRVDKSQMNPYQLFDVCIRSHRNWNITHLFLEQVAKKSFQPYTFQTPEFFDWWTVYISTSDQSDPHLQFMSKVISRTKGSFEVLS
jgi:phenol 2-monooxygenase